MTPPVASASEQELDRLLAELVFVPIKLDASFDFSRFLEDLAVELPAEELVARLRSQHPVVMQALRSALSGEIERSEGWRTAGTLIALRALADTPGVASEAGAEAIAIAIADDALERAEAAASQATAAAALVASLGARLESVEAALRDAEAERRIVADAVREIPDLRDRAEQELSHARRNPLTAAGGAAAGSDRAEPKDPSVRSLTSREREPPPLERAPEAGFDEDSTPLARLALDGHFRALNPAFSSLIGYPEHEFQKAVWPSAHDRGAYRDQQEQLRSLAAGELESVRVRSTYMHGQGIMVQVTGTISAVRGGDGQPAHLLLRAEERASH